jgi:hypothetical protein
MSRKQCVVPTQAASPSPGPAGVATPPPSLVSAIPQQPCCKSTLGLLAMSKLCPLPRAAAPRRPVEWRRQDAAAGGAHSGGGAIRA